MSNIFVVRHAHSQHNGKGLIVDVSDGSCLGLTDIGIEQARDVSKQLAGIQFDKVFVSPLKRAACTAKYICDKEQVVDDRLRERHLTEYIGKRHEPQEQAEFDMRSLWFKSDQQPVGQNIEKMQDVRRRVYSFIEDIKSKYAGKNVLVVTHSGPCLYFKEYKFGVPADFDYLPYRTDNCEIIIIENE